MRNDKPRFDKDEKRCSYQCPYYLDGSVCSWCNLYNKAVQYDGNIPPLRTPECLAETEDKI